MSDNVGENLNSDTNDGQHRSLLLLQQQGLIDAQVVRYELAINRESDQHTPWFINALFGFSGLFASLLFIGFLTLILFETRAFESAISLVITGLFLSVVAFIFFKNEHTAANAFMSSLAFAVGVAGQAYVLFALVTSDLREPIGVALFLGIQCCLAFIIPNFVYRLLGFTVVFGGIVYLLNFYQLPELGIGVIALITVITHLQRYSLLRRIPKRLKAHFYDVSSAISYASALVLLGVSVYFIAATDGAGFERHNDAFIYNYYLAQGLLTLASLYATYLILQRYGIKLLSATGLIMVSITAVLGVMSIYVSGLLATSLVIVIAFANSQRVLLALGIIALVSYIFWYYYQLDTSLLLKSVSMLIIGIGLLLIRWLLIKRYFIDDESVINNESLVLDTDKERSL